MPAEWEPQEAVWLSWPHNRDTWPGYFESIPAVFADIGAAITRYQKLRVNGAAALKPDALRLLREAGACMERVEWFDHETNDSWCRDHGPIFVRNPSTREVALTDWQYNAWGGKYPPFDLDNRIPGKIADAIGLRRFACDMVLEGGSIEVDGQGQLLTTEACLLHPNRNPHLTREQIEDALRRGLGVHTIHWVGDGIIGDDTDGHIDDLTRFFRPDGLLTVVEPNTDDPNHPILQENLERLQSLRTPDGRPFTIRELPMPAPCHREGQRMPASYANFLVINGAVLLPVFRQPGTDKEAAEILADAFPGREIIPIDALDLVWGLGTLHCISQQQPR